MAKLIHQATADDGERRRRITQMEQPFLTRASSMVFLFFLFFFLQFSNLNCSSFVLNTTTKFIKSEEFKNQVKQ